MAYFANGSQGDRYQSKWCDRCINWHELSPGDENWGCPVWDLHMDANYDQGNTVKGRLWKYALENFIPTGEDHWPQKCRMFFKGH